MSPNPREIFYFLYWCLCFYQLPLCGRHCFACFVSMFIYSQSVNHKKFELFQIPCSVVEMKGARPIKFLLGSNSRLFTNCNILVYELTVCWSIFSIICYNIKFQPQVWSAQTPISTFSKFSLTNIDSVSMATNGFNKI